MRAASLLGVFLASRLLLLLDRPLPLSVWTPFAFIWQDLLVALAFLLLDLRARRSRAAWALYGLVVVYTAINVPLIRVLSSPLTLPMLRATRGMLADSIVHHFSAGNLLLLALVLALGAALPCLLRRLP